jgi:hypothetical protein
MFALVYILWSSSVENKALVSYSYYYSGKGNSPDYDNLEFFLRHARIRLSLTTVDFVFSIVGASKMPVIALFERLPNTIFIVNDTNRKTDLCSHYHNFRTHRKPEHDIFVTINSGVRGPFWNQYDRYNYELTAMDWIRPFSSKLDRYVRIAGSLISCQKSPHLQSWFMVTDKQGVDIMQNTWRTCPWKTHMDAITSGEVGLSTRILQLNMTFASQQPMHSRKFSGRCDDSKKNPTTLDYDIYRHLFVKYGGEIWRKNMLHKSVNAQVRAFTKPKN